MKNTPLNKFSFTENLLRHNNLNIDFSEWVFYPGMLFRSADIWWGKGNKRKTLHEGLDICYYRDLNGQIRNLEKETLIPLMSTGEIIKIEDDFIGKSIYVRHQFFKDQGKYLHTIYGHTTLLNNLKTGDIIQEGDVIATIADPAVRKRFLPPHLHITVALISGKIPAERLNWQSIQDPQTATLLDPLKILDGKHTIILSQ